MNHQDKNIYQSGEFDEFFEESAVNGLAADEVVAYSKSSMKLWEDRQAVDYVANKNREIGRKEGRMEGAESMKATLIKSFAKTLSAEKIAETLGMPLQAGLGYLK